MESNNKNVNVFFEKQKSENKKSKKDLKNNKRQNNQEPKIKEPSIQQKFEQANNLMIQRNYIKAEEIYLKLYNNSSTISNQFSINLYNQLALCYYNQIKFKKAVEIASTIILKYDNKNKKAYLLILKVLYDLGEINKAYELEEKIISLYKRPKDLEIFKNMFHLINLGKKEEENKIERDIYFKRQKIIMSILNNGWLKWTLATSTLVLGGFLITKFLYRK